MSQSNIMHIDQEPTTNTKVFDIVQNLYHYYSEAIKQSGYTLEEGDQLFHQLIELVTQQAKSPFKFDIFHKSIREPFDYHQFGLDFFRPLIDFSHSHLLGQEHINCIQQQLAKGENVILLANHQTESDPQMIGLMLETYDPVLAANLIFVAGHRVIEDPVAIPMSMGCHLLCIYSKKHIGSLPQDKAKKVSHNQRTMKKMGELLEEGGKCIYVAPSGGRDRPDIEGQIKPAPFDPDSLEMFWLIAKQAHSPTHFYPLSLTTYHIMPPPNQVEKELGERREVYHAPVGLCFGPEVDMEHFSGSQGLGKKEKRVKRAEYIWNLVCQDYAQLVHLTKTH